MSMVQDEVRPPVPEGPIRVAIADDQELVRAGFAMVIGSQPDMQVVGQAGDGAAAVDLAARLRPDVVLMDVRMPVMDGIEATRRILGGGAGSAGTGGIDMDAELRAAMAQAAGAGASPSDAAPGVAGTVAVHAPGMSASAPGMSAQGADARNATAHRTRVIILTTFDLDEYVMAAIKAGASGFLLKDTEPETMLNSIRTVFRGDAVIAPSATRRLIEKMMHEPEPSSQPTAAPKVPDPADSPELASLTEREREVLVEIAHGLSNQEIARKLFISLPTVKTHVAHILAKTYSRDRVQAVVFAYETGLVR